MFKDLGIRTWMSVGAIVLLARGLRISPQPVQYDDLGESRLDEC